MYAIDWTPSAVSTVWHAVRKFPRLAPGFRRRPLCIAIERVIYDL